MSYWSVRHPEQMEEIANLPMTEQNDALRRAMRPPPEWQVDGWREMEQERLERRQEEDEVRDLEGEPWD